MSRREDLILGAVCKLAEAKRLGSDAYFVRALALVEEAQSDLREADRYPPEQTFDVVETTFPPRPAVDLTGARVRPNPGLDRTNTGGSR